MSKPLHTQPSLGATTKTLPPALQQQRNALPCATPEARHEEFKVVVADDSRVYRALVEGVLAQEECQVLFARNGREALDAVAEHQPALVITDWEMPDITGIELCKEIRKEESYIYIILLTSNNEKDQVIEGLAAGADDYLTKPFHSGELVARVGVGRRLFDLHRQIQNKNILLQELALTDSLTGLPNRRAVEEWASRELNGAARHGFMFWVVLADLDNFKGINDRHGHQAGDVVLQRFAEVLKTNTRSSNMCGRLGGEEFVLALTHVDKDGIKIAIERVRQQLEAEEFRFGDSVTKVTASFGVGGFLGGKAQKFDELLRNADLALYEAKHNGRNRLEFGANSSGSQDISSEKALKATKS
jgi:two-component system, cell cycle response regulator